MYKLIALDMDGTLLNSQGQISPRTHAAIAAARARGVTVVLASGRPLEGMSRYLVELGLTGQDDYVICYNGALVQQVADQRIIRSQLLTGSDASAIAALADELGINVHGFSVSRGLISPRVSPYTEHESRLIDMPIKLLDFATLPADEQILKVMMIDPEPLLSPAIAKLPAELYQRYTVVRSAPYFLEFMNKQSNKGTGVAALAEHLGLDASQVIAVGDAGNDHHMIEYAGLGVAMGNATDDIKALAQHTTGRNDEDGVAQVIERFILNT
ncbi:sugar-phosphatase [Aeromonas hydrophila]|uniref:sugar-phosphatase n=1 Tax=Aeromonas hydrophila TaxID=644 RepID=UPI001CF01482|nr:sugar-phosphatase [Aeromonas hydrophila]HEB4991299.1 sugar-phosphatase [Aeromonas hydrophila subsp. hydrophila]MCK0184338.1 sugar-phosphatase [Aeromonas hydrophila]MCR3951776.1 sugar-phosphatase [Aeromonas hydrophila]MCW4614881.1 sugar-phosphatase [Aeromonas hydrophila]UCM57206.1 sugar-phosphatase [Aeromonas hydrophila]